MNYDLAFRFARALQPEALTTIHNACTALVDAIKDARNAGCDIERDPAVILLGRHLGRVASGLDPAECYPADGAIRQACFERMAELRSKPALVPLARRGVGYDPEAKRAFHREARAALAALARQLGLVPGDYDLRINAGGISVSGEVTLHTETAYVQISCGVMGPGREILYRRCQGRRDYCGDRNHFADIALAVDAERFARILKRELHLAPHNARQDALPTATAA
ncbi:MAG: hypothetical protein WA793_00865 [Sphingorhabdus sp.]|uniref:hypothetical protein n=1 Tax=Sphingorhabdus sp. TaxID=1902408 RepID=UPI003CC02FA4